MNPFLDFLESFVAGWKRARERPEVPDHTKAEQHRARISEWTPAPPPKKPEE